MKTYNDLVNESLEHVEELFPWDLEEAMEQGKRPMIVDIREPYEFEKGHIKGSINVPRGILEAACEYDYEETVPELVKARDKDIILVCRSGYRSALGAYTMQLMGYKSVSSLKTGLRGWNDYEQPLFDINENLVDVDDAEEYFTARLRPEQHNPADK
ncbi:rhodanese-like domain-containing protein [Kaarinaea lacus]